MDNLDDLLSDLAWIDSGWFRVTNPETGAAALFPNVPVLHGRAARVAEDQWEQRALAMHENQETIRLTPKPAENRLAARVVRGD